MTIASRPRYQTLALDLTGTRHLFTSDHPAATLGGAERWTLPLAALPARLARERMGLRLYALGTEPFLWDVAGIAEAAGMGCAEIQLQHAGSLRRRVQCVHCATVIEDVTTSIVPCPGCHAALFVRDHFSRALAAFQGVRVDAEIPGDIPTPEPIYR